MQRKDTEETMFFEDYSWKARICGFIWIAFMLLIAGAASWGYSQDPATVRLDTTTDVEHLAAEKGLEVVPEGDIQLMFTQGKGFGGAGGQGNTIIMKKGPMELIEEASRENRSLRIHYSYEAQGGWGYADKLYVAAAPEASYGWTKRFQPVGFYAFDKAASTDKELAFHKDPAGLVLALLIMGVLGAFACALLYGAWVVVEGVFS
jgi:hypothetical protein